MRLFRRVDKDQKVARLSEQARAYELGGMYGMAVDYYKAALQLEPGRADIRNALAKTERALHLRQQASAHSEVGNASEAIRCCHEILRIYPDDVDTRIILAIEYRELGRLGDAIRELLHCLRQAPDNGEVLGTLGLISCQQGNLRQGVDYMEKAVAHLTDQNVRGAVMGTLGAAYHMLGERRRGIECWHKAIYLDSQSFESHLCLGLAYLEEGQLEQALREFRVSDSLAPDRSSLVKRAPTAMIEAAEFLIRKSRGSSRATPSDELLKVIEMLVPMAWGVIPTLR